MYFGYFVGFLPIEIVVYLQPPPPTSHPSTPTRSSLLGQVTSRNDSSGRSGQFGQLDQFTSGQARSEKVSTGRSDYLVHVKSIRSDQLTFIEIRPVEFRSGQVKSISSGHVCQVRLDV